MKKSLRKPSTLSFDEEAEEDEGIGGRPTSSSSNSLAKPVRERRRAERRQSALSFEDGDEGDTQPAILRPIRPKATMSRGHTNLDAKVETNGVHASTQLSSAGAWCSDWGLRGCSRGGAEGLAAICPALFPMCACFAKCPRRRIQLGTVARAEETNVSLSRRQACICGGGRLQSRRPGPRAHASSRAQALFLGAGVRKRQRLAAPASAHGGRGG